MQTYHQESRVATHEIQLENVRKEIVEDINSFLPLFENNIINLEKGDFQFLKYNKIFNIKSIETGSETFVVGINEAYSIISDLTDLNTDLLNQISNFIVKELEKI